MLRVHIANLRCKIEPTDGPPLIHTEYRVGYRLADAHPEGVCRMRPAGDAIDGEVVQRRARVTTKFPSRGLRVA
jgi:DNA-binding winged helix-turn-helix (wHTH) protein